MGKNKEKIIVDMTLPGAGDGDGACDTRRDLLPIIVKLLALKRVA